MIRRPTTFAAPRRRAGFTLVELLVAMALIVLIMAILSQAFAEGMTTFRHLKALGDLQERLRTGTTLLRSDLTAFHFDGGRDKLSDPHFNRPEAGFVRIQQLPLATPPGIPEGTDADGLPSTRATTHILHLTVRKTGPRRADWLTALPAPAPLQMQGPPAYWQTGGMISQEAEVCWFLVPRFDAATGAQVTAGTTPLWTLHRRQRLLAEQGTSAPGAATDFPDVSCQASANGIRCFDLRDTARAGMGGVAPFRSMMDPTGQFSFPQPVTNTNNGQPTWDDLVMADVVSFEIKILRPGRFQFEYVAEAEAAAGLPPTGVYDTATSDPRMLRVLAIQITLRVYDYRTEQTRQITIVQDM